MRHTATSSAALERNQVIQSKEPIDTSDYMPEHDDNSRDSLRVAEYEWHEPRTRYGYIRVNRLDPEYTEGGFARARADNNFANLAKFADISDVPAGAVTGAGIGALAMGAVMHHKLKGSGWLSRNISKITPAAVKNKIMDKQIAGGAMAGAISGAGVGLMNKKQKDASDEAHAYITDVGVSVFPKRMGPADLSQAFHMDNPTAKYLPAIGTMALGVGSALTDLSRGRDINMARLVALATMGGGAGTLARLVEENRYMHPYKKGFIHNVEKKYNKKLASSAPVQEYITETNIEVLPFHDTAPGDLEAAYNFKHPAHALAPALGTMAGVGGALALGGFRRKPVSLGNTLLAGTVGGVAAAVVAQIRKDQVLQKFRKPVVDSINEKYRML